MRLECRVIGRVQGVGFRYFVKQIANALDLKGWVRNEVDGSVFIVAEGEKEKLEKLIEKVKEGPSLSRVDNVIYQFFDEEEGETYFTVKY